MLALGACVDRGLVSGSPDGATPSPVATRVPHDPANAVRDAEDFVAAQKRAYCDSLVRCGYVDAVTEGRCTEAVGAYSAAFYGFFVPPACSLDLGRVRLDFDAAASCLAAESTVACADAWDTPEICQRVLVPTVAEGGACDADGECGDASLFCRNGVCARGTLEAGAACGDWESNRCRDGFICGLHDVCQKIPGLGEPCAEFPHCATGLACMPSALGGGHVCGLRGKLGERCDEGNFERTCADGLGCDLLSTPHVCIPQAHEGEVCHSYYGCAGDLACLGGNVTPFPAEGGLCMRAVPLGSTCEPFFGEPRVPTAFCREYAMCVDSVCIPVAGLGEPCHAWNDCPAGFCHPTTNVCTPLGGAGDVCYPGVTYSCRLDLGCDNSTMRCRDAKFLTCAP